MKLISFYTLIIATIFVCSLEAMKLQTPIKEPLFTLEEGKMVFTDAYWTQRECIENDAMKRIIAHKKNEYNFTRLLAAECKEPQEARWAQIQPLLRNVGAYTNINRDVRTALANAYYPDIDKESGQELEKTFTYQTWLSVVNPQAHAALYAEQEAPPLPTLPELDALQQLPQMVMEDTPGQAHDTLQKLEEKIQGTELQQSARESQQAAHSKKRNIRRKPSHVTPKKQTSATSALVIHKPVIIKKPASSPRDIPNFAFTIALCNNDIKEVKEICSHGKINLNIPPDKSNIPPLLTCVTVGNTKMTECLLELGANPDTQTAVRLTGSKGWVKTTPLLIAIRNASVDDMKVLLEHKADTNIPAEYIPSRRIEFALDVALKKKAKDVDNSTKCRETMARLLLKHGATKFSGTVSHFDTDTCKIKSLNLDTQHALVQKLLLNHEKLDITESSITIYAPQSKGT